MPKVPPQTPPLWTPLLNAWKRQSPPVHRVTHDVLKHVGLRLAYGGYQWPATDPRHPYLYRPPLIVAAQCIPHPIVDATRVILYHWPDQYFDPYRVTWYTLPLQPEPVRLVYRYGAFRTERSRGIVRKFTFAWPDPWYRPRMIYDHAQFRIILRGSPGRHYNMLCLPRPYPAPTHNPQISTLPLTPPMPTTNLPNYPPSYWPPPADAAVWEYQTEWE